MLRTLVESRRQPHALRRTLPAVGFSLLFHATVLSWLLDLRDGDVSTPTHKSEDIRIVWIPPSVQRARIPAKLPPFTPRLSGLVRSNHPAPPQLDLPRSPMPQRPMTFGSGFAALTGGVDWVGRGGDDRLVYRVEELDAGPECLAAPAVPYPVVMRRAGIEGTVVLEAVVDISGRVQRETVVIAYASHSGFVAAAQQMLQACSFRPGRVHGRPVPVLVQFPVKFELVNR